MVPPSRLVLLTAALLATGLAGAANLVQNGRFEDGLDGWTLTLDSVEGSWVAMTAPEFEPDIDREVLVEKILRYSAALSQATALPGLDTRFAFRARLYAFVVADTGGYHAHAAVTLAYLNASGAELGRTMVLRRTAQSPLVSTPTRHVIVAPDESWHDYEFVIREELANLAGVNPPDVARVCVYLQAYGTGIGG